MKTIIDTINEGRANNREIEKYCHDWITSVGTAEEYEAVLQAIKRGLSKGCDENLKYLKDDDEQKATKKLDDIITDWDIPSARLGDWDD